jgi:3-oxoacyl-[acyl-carrier protein] reductase
MKIIITGASGAIGGTLACQLATPENTLILVGRNAEKLHALREQLSSAESCITHSADLTNADGIVSLQTALADIGTIDALAHCVGSTVVRPLHMTSEKDWLEQFSVNATSAFLMLKWFVAQALKAQQSASAVLVSSVVAEAGFANHEAIAAAKCAVTGLAMSAAASYADKGIRVNVVAPGLTRSPLTERFISTPEAEARSAAMIPNGRIGEPAEVAHAMAYLLSPYAGHISGQVLRVDGGQAMLRPLPKQQK